MKRRSDKRKYDHEVRQPLRPRKSLGQNFLRDPNIARRIIRSIDPHPDEVILEIGPGEGALTKELALKGGPLIAVDVDKRVVERMRDLIPAAEILHGDFLDLDLQEIAQKYGGTIRVVGNIPYNITSPILFHLLEYRTVVRDATLMMQKEVARRIAAAPGTKEYGILSVFFQLFTVVNILFDVSHHAFYPEPDVTSTVIRLEMRTTPRCDLADEKIFRSMVRSVFGKRRKMLRGSMKYFCDEHGYSLPDGLDLTRRPEDLSIEELVSMSNALVESGAHA